MEYLEGEHALRATVVDHEIECFGLVADGVDGMASRRHAAIPPVVEPGSHRENRRLVLLPHVDDVEGVAGHDADDPLVSCEMGQVTRAARMVVAPDPGDAMVDAVDGDRAGDAKGLLRMTRAGKVGHGDARRRLEVPDRSDRLRLEVPTDREAHAAARQAAHQLVAVAHLARTFVAEFEALQRLDDVERDVAGAGPGVVGDGLTPPEVEVGGMAAHVEKHAHAAGGGPGLEERRLVPARDVVLRITEVVGGRRHVERVGDRFETEPGNGTHGLLPFAAHACVSEVHIVYFEP